MKFKNKEIDDLKLNIKKFGKEIKNLQNLINNEEEFNDINSIENNSDIINKQNNGNINNINKIKLNLNNKNLNEFFP